MSTQSLYLPAADETPIQINGGEACEIQLITLANSSATGAWIKLYQSATTPTGSSVPNWQTFQAQGCQPWAPFLGGSQWWIVVSTNPGASLAAPAADLVGALTFAKLR